MLVMKLPLCLLGLLGVLSAVNGVPVPSDVDDEEEASVFVPEGVRVGVNGNGAPIIGGQGEFRFQYDPTKVVMPEGTNTMNSHGLSVDADNNIILTYQPQAPDTHCLVQWSPDGTDGKVLPMADGLCAGTPHGLRLANENGKQVLYHANNNAVLHKTDMTGAPLWTVEGPPNNDTSFTPYKPTWFATPPGSDYVYMSDGYGSNFIHVFTTDGKYTGHTFGGRGTLHGKFQTCHSVNFDPRRGLLVVSDRENHRHEYFAIDNADPSKFEYVHTSMVQQLVRPCNMRFFGETGHAIVPALEGPVGILDADNQLVSLVNVTDLLGDQGHLHPHDAIMLPSGDMVVCTWNPGRISYWKRLPADRMQADSEE